MPLALIFSYESTIQVNETLKIAQPLRFVASDLGIVRSQITGESRPIRNLWTLPEPLCLEVIEEEWHMNYP